MKKASKRSGLCASMYPYLCVKLVPRVIVTCLIMSPIGRSRVVLQCRRVLDKKNKELQLGEKEKNENQGGFCLSPTLGYLSWSLVVHITEILVQRDADVESQRLVSTVVALCALVLK